MFSSLISGLCLFTQRVSGRFTCTMEIAFKIGESSCFIFSYYRNRGHSRNRLIDQRYNFLFGKNFLFLVLFFSFCSSAQNSSNQCFIWSFEYYVRVLFLHRRSLILCSVLVPCLLLPLLVTVQMLQQIEGLSVYLLILDLYIN